MKKDKFSRNGYRPFMPERDRHVRPSVQEGKEEGERGPIRKMANE